jgi:NAD(P)-dependent dehydrogenase (short-subunit alcohol dehydrogenase family)
MNSTLRGKVIVVTGANTGIGKATARKLARMEATVIVVARHQGRGSDAVAEIRTSSGNPDVRLMLCDLSSQVSIREFAAEFRSAFDRLDVLVNNAGKIILRRQENTDGLEMTFAVNHLGPFLLTNLLMDTLKAGAPSRIVNVASSAHHVNRIDFDDLQRHKRYGRFGQDVYGESKLMNILFTYELARRVEGAGVTVNAMHPGFVRTNFVRRDNGFLVRLFAPLAFIRARTPEKGAETAVYLASSPEVEGVTGKYFKDKKALPSSSLSYDEGVQKRLWQASEAALIRVDD